MDLDLSRIKELRKEFNYSQQQVADEVKINRVSYSKIETNKSEPKLSTVVLLADLFDVSIDYLINRSDERL